MEPSDDHETLSLVSKKLASPKTTRVRIVSPVSPLGNKGYRSSLCPSLVEALHLRTLSPKTGTSSLTHLYLIRQKFNGAVFRLQMLPKSLVVLHLRETHIDNLCEESNYFLGLSDHFSSLEELDLSYCSWVSGHSLMSLSKFPCLTKLRLRGCRRVGECLAYVSLASRFGFKSLKVTYKQVYWTDNRFPEMLKILPKKLFPDFGRYRHKSGQQWVHRHELYHNPRRILFWSVRPILGQRV